MKSIHPFNYHYNEPQYRPFWDYPEERDQALLEYFLSKFPQEYPSHILMDFQLLPLFYILPKDLVVKIGYAEWPRTLREFLTSPKWVDIYYSDEFTHRLQSAIAFLIWPSFGVPGYIDNYSIDDYFYVTANSLNVWYVFLKNLGCNAKYLANRPPNESIPYWNYVNTIPDDPYNINNIMQMAFEGYVAASDYLEIRKVMLQHRAFEDYSEQNSHVKIDFYRKYYHTRAKSGHMEPLENHPNAGGIVYEENGIVDRIVFDRFKDTLSEKDRGILTLLERDRTQQEIAAILGYSNNSGVSKRLKHIARRYLDYIDEDTGRKEFLQK